MIVVPCQNETASSPWEIVLKEGVSYLKTIRTKSTGLENNARFTLEMRRTRHDLPLSTLIDSGTVQHGREWCKIYRQKEDQAAYMNGFIAFGQWKLTLMDTVSTSTHEKEVPSPRHYKLQNTLNETRASIIPKIGKRNMPLLGFYWEFQWRFRGKFHKAKCWLLE